MPDADLSLAVPAVFFGSVGTAGQRCTSTRRLYVHRSIAPEFLEKLQALYAKVQPGDPLVSGTLLGPVHNQQALNIYANAVQTLRSSGADILTGGSRYSGLKEPLGNGNFVQPTISIPASTDPKSSIWSTETFAPILNVAIFDELEQAIEWNNAVPQGLSSSLWTRDIRAVGKWIGPAGSDAGIVNVSSTNKTPFYLSSHFACFEGECRYQWRRDRCSVWREQGQSSSNWSEQLSIAGADHTFLIHALFRSEHWMVSSTLWKLMRHLLTWN